VTDGQTDGHRAMAYCTLSTAYAISCESSISIVSEI